MDVGLSEVLACPPPAPPTAPASRQSAPQSPLTKPGGVGHSPGAHLLGVFRDDPALLGREELSEPGGDPGDTELHGVYPPQPPHPQCATHSTASPGDVPSLGAEGHIPITQFRAHSYPPAPKGRFPTPRTPYAPPRTPRAPLTVVSSVRSSSGPSVS